MVNLDDFEYTLECNDIVWIYANKFVGGQCVIILKILLTFARLSLSQYSAARRKS